MKKLTPKQRREIYLKVAEYLIAKKPYLSYICWIFIDFGYRYPDFEEFNLFNPKNGSVWFTVNNGLITREEQRNARIICMLLCAEIVKDAKD